MLSPHKIVGNLQYFQRFGAVILYLLSWPSPLANPVPLVHVVIPYHTSPNHGFGTLFTSQGFAEIIELSQHQIGSHNIPHQISVLWDSSLSSLPGLFIAFILSSQSTIATSHTIFTSKTSTRYYANELTTANTSFM